VKTFYTLKFISLITITAQRQPQVRGERGFRGVVVVGNMAVAEGVSRRT